VSLTMRPCRALLVFLVAVAVAVTIAVRIVIHLAANQPPRNDQTTLDQLRSQFAQTAWEPDLISAYWDSSGKLKVGLDRDDRQLALKACSDLIGIVQVQASTGPNGVVYTSTSSDRSLFIFDRSDRVIVTDFLSLNSGCRWRLN
jgi:hypothetical protein